MTEKEKRFLSVAADYFNALLILVYVGLSYFLVCAILDHVVPLIVLTTRTAHEFWIFGVSAFMFGMVAFVLFKDARNPKLRAVQARVSRAIGIVLEGFIFIGAIALWTEAGRYAAWVGQYTEIAANSGVDTRYWIAAVLFAHGIAGNLLAALLTA